MARLRKTTRTVQQVFKVAPPKLDEQDWLPKFTANINKQLSLISERFARIPEIEGFNPADYVQTADLRDELIRIDEEDEALVDTEGEEEGEIGGGGGRKRQRRTSRRRRFMWEIAGSALEAAEPTAAPPEVEDASAIGTTTAASTGDVPRFALEDHTHSGMNLSDPQTAAGLKQFSSGIVVFGSLLLDNTGTATQLRFREPSGGGSSVTTFAAQAQAADVNYLLPAAQASAAGQALLNDGAGTLSWGTPAGTIIVQEDDTTVDAVATTLDFTEPDAILVTSSPAGEANVNLSAYILRGVGRTGGTTIIGSQDTNTGLILRATSGVGVAGSEMIFQVGNNGATEVMRFMSTGRIGVNETAPACGFEAGDLEVATIAWSDGENRSTAFYVRNALDENDIATQSGVFGVDMAFTPTAATTDNVNGTFYLLSLNGANSFTGNNHRAMASRISVTATGATLDNACIGMQCTLANENGSTTPMTSTGSAALVGQVQLRGANTVTAAAAFRSRFDLANIAGTLTDGYGLYVSTVSKGAAYTLTNFTSIQIDDQTAAGTNLSLRSAGAGVEMRHRGNAGIGFNGATSATLHVQEDTINNEVVRIESLATNDDPNFRVFQARAATTDATVTTLFSFTLTAGRAYLIEARVVAHRTGGIAGAADDSAVYIVYAGAKHTGGVAALITAVGADYTDEDQAAWNATIDVDGANAVRVRVTGAADNNITWHGTIFVQDVGS